MTMNTADFKFKLLDRITVDNYLQSDGVIRLAYYNNEYYLLEHYNAVKDKILPLGNGYYTVQEGVEIKVIPVKSEAELLSKYIDRFLIDRINPFKVLLLYKQYNLNINPRLKEILERNKDSIPDHILLEQIELLEYHEKKKPEAMIVIEPFILDAITEILKMFEEKKELLKKAEQYKDKLKARVLTVKDAVFESINASKDLVEYPSKSKLVAKVENELLGLERDIAKIEEQLLKKAKEGQVQQGQQGQIQGQGQVQQQQLQQQLQQQVQGQSGTAGDSSSSSDSGSSSGSTAGSGSGYGSYSDFGTEGGSGRMDDDEEEDEAYPYPYSIYMELSRTLTKDEQEQLKNNIIKFLTKIGVKVNEYKVL
jgi:hypothetical protein